MILFNPTDTVIHCGYSGMSSVFGPGTQKEIYDTHAAFHMLRRWGKNGLVSLNYGEKEATIFFDFDEYKHAKTIEGLKRQVESLEAKLIDNQVYDDEFGDLNSPYRAMNKKRIDEIQLLIKNVKEKIKKLEAMNVRKTPQERAALLVQKARELERQAKQLLKEEPNDADGSRHN